MIYIPVLLVVAAGSVWWAVRWAKQRGRNPWRLAGILVLLWAAYFGQWMYAFGKSVSSYQPARLMLELTRAELKRQGMEPNVGLGGNGPYSGCNVLLLEHFIFGCFSLRTGVGSGLSPETIRAAVQAVCSGKDCPYQGWFRLSILYMGAPQTYVANDGGKVTTRKQLGTYRFTLNGGTK